MQAVALPVAPNHHASVFYTEVMKTLDAAGIPYLVGGTYALNHYTGILRPTKDLDLFVGRRSLEDALAALAGLGYRTEITHPHFLGKAYAGTKYVDVIFSSGNGSCDVDDWWFEHAPRGELFDLPVRFCPIEEMIWSKAFVMERERYDGHDVIHLLRAGSHWIDWDRLVSRFGANWRVLLSYLVLFGFVYPGERARIPDVVLDELVARLQNDPVHPSDANLCRGTLLSRSQYLHDVHQLGFSDARVEPFGAMTPEQTAQWTNAIDADQDKTRRGAKTQPRRRRSPPRSRRRGGD
jgi:hypothetical protein